MALTLECEMDDVDAVLAANREFYRAFESADLDAMSDAWSHGDDVACTHPGWATLHGWAAVAASWYALFNNGEHLQFIVTNEHAQVEGDIAWVTCDENILAGDGGSGGTVAALNLYRRSNGGWKLVAHHGSPVARL
jgi:ketosteroid isomerase-like protein